MRTSGLISYFTHDIGFAENPKFLSGPLVLTYLDPEAEVEVRCGHPANHEDDSPLIVLLSGKTFQGSFFVCPGWAISGTSRLALVSGFFPDPDLTLLESVPQNLPSGGRLIYRPLIESELQVRIPRDGKLMQAQMAAVREAEARLGHEISPTDDWTPGEENQLVLSFNIRTNSIGIERRVETLRDQAQKPTK